MNRTIAPPPRSIRLYLGLRSLHCRDSREAGNRSTQSLSLKESRWGGTTKREELDGRSVESSWFAMDRAKE
jgi:hypothetical protein